MTIYVSNLAFQAGDEDLRNLFIAYGKVASAKVVTDTETNKSRGFGLVEMPNDSEGEQAIKKLNGATVEGRSISVTIARPRERTTFRRRNNSW